MGRGGGIGKRGGRGRGERGGGICVRGGVGYIGGWREGEAEKGIGQSRVRKTTQLDLIRYS